MTIEYRKWLLRELFDLIFSLENRGLKPEAKMFLFMINSAIIQLFDSNKAEQREKLLDYLLNALEEMSERMGKERYPNCLISLL